jgi:hypothetical protein
VTGKIDPTFGWHPSDAGSLSGTAPKQKCGDAQVEGSGQAAPGSPERQGSDPAAPRWVFLLSSLIAGLGGVLHTTLNAPVVNLCLRSLATEKKRKAGGHS